MKKAVGTSNIEEQSLPFDLSIFKALLQIEVKTLTFAFCVKSRVCDG